MIPIKIIVIIAIFLFCLLTIIRVLQGILPKRDGWILISLFILLVTVSFYPINLSLSAAFGGVLSILFLFIPQWGLNRINHLFEIKNYPKSRHLLSKLIGLHPTTYWHNYYRLLFALELADSGKKKQAIRLLTHNHKNDYIFNYYYQLFIYEILGDWGSCLEWFNYQVDQKILQQDPLLLTYYIRTLGETEQMDKLFQNICTVQSLLLKLKKYSYIPLIKLYAFAFSGQITLMKTLFNTELSFYPKYLQGFWLITAKTVMDQNKDNYKILLKQHLHDYNILKSSLEWRLKTLSFSSTKNKQKTGHKLFYKLNHHHKEVNTHQKLFRVKNQKITQLLIILNLLGFVTEISFGGSENIETLYQLGALVPLVVWHGEFWRLITANFLHYGWGHFLMNMLALYFMGNLLESLSNKYHYIIVYLLSGIGSMLAFSYVAIYTNQLDYILVGASASIMGLVGSLTAIFMRKWLHNKSLIDRKRVMVMTLIISLQLISDLIIPQISMLSHLFGLFIGFITEIIGSFFINKRTYL